MTRITILDGGMGRELKRIGAPFRQPEWSALALIEAPEAVTGVHRAYAEAGAEVITTNSYALVPFHLGEARFGAEAQALAHLAGRLAREIANSAGRIRVAASLPPLFGSYRPDLFDPGKAARLLAPLVSGLAPHADLWLAETLSATAEAEAVAQALAGDARERWFSFTLGDDVAESRAAPSLRSGESIEAAVGAAAAAGSQAILFNCSQPEVMEAAIRAAVQYRENLGAGLAIGVYANAFPPQREDASANEDLLPIREDLDPTGYLGWAQRWINAGATIVGGCCGIGPEHIAAISGWRSEKSS